MIMNNQDYFSTAALRDTYEMTTGELLRLRSLYVCKFDNLMYLNLPNKLLLGRFISKCQ